MPQGDELYLPRKPRGNILGESWLLNQGKKSTSTLHLGYNSPVPPQNWMVDRLGLPELKAKLKAENSLRTERKTKRRRGVNFLEEN